MPDRLRTLIVAMAKQMLPVPEQIPNDANINDENTEHGFRKSMDQLVHLDGDEEGRFANGQPAGPAHAKHQAHSLHQREEAVKQCAHRYMEHPGLRELADLQGEVGKEL